MFGTRNGFATDHNISSNRGWLPTLAKMETFIQVCDCKMSAINCSSSPCWEPKQLLAVFVWLSQSNRGLFKVPGVGIKLLCLALSRRPLPQGKRIQWLPGTESICFVPDVLACLQKNKHQECLWYEFRELINTPWFLTMFYIPVLCLGRGGVQWSLSEGGNETRKD